MNRKPNYKWQVIEGIVNTSTEYLMLSCAGQSYPYALLSRGRDRTVIVQYFTGNKPWHVKVQEGLDTLHEEIHYCVFIKKDEADPWHYMVSRGAAPQESPSAVEWRWYPDGLDPVAELEMMKEEQEPDMKELSKPESPAFIQYQLGKAHFRNGEHLQALRCLSRSIEIENDNAQVFQCRAAALRELGDFDRAIADLDRAIELNPKCDTAYSDRGYCYLLKDEYDRALADIDRAIEIDPDYPAYYGNRACIKMNMEEASAALQDYEKAISLDPSEAGFYEAKGDAYLKLGKTDLACQALEEALAVNPMDIEVFARVAQLKKLGTGHGGQGFHSKTEGTEKMETESGEI